MFTEDYERDIEELVRVLRRVAGTDPEVRELLKRYTWVKP